MLSGQGNDPADGRAGAAGHGEARDKEALAPPHRAALLRAPGDPASWKAARGDALAKTTELDGVAGPRWARARGSGGRGRSSSRVTVVQASQEAARLSRAYTVAWAQNLRMPYSGQSLMSKLSKNISL